MYAVRMPLHLHRRAAQPPSAAHDTPTDRRIRRVAYLRRDAAPRPAPDGGAGSIPRRCEDPGRLPVNARFPAASMLRPRLIPYSSVELHSTVALLRIAACVGAVKPGGRPAAG